MEKYAVVTDKELKKQGEHGPPKCPRCSAELISEDPAICPNCGSKPMEQKDGGEKKDQ